jgi:3',5'-cyclic AMP phosphodiesterase CpdA
VSTIVFLSDLHLSHTHGFFWENFRRARDAANASDADAVIVTGDLCINGPDSDAEMQFASQALEGLDARVFALPGNHDVGDEPPGQDPAQIVDEARLARWDAAFTTDRFAIDAGAWRLLGVNAQLFGSGLPREAEQDAWLDEQLAGARGRPVALVLHKPLFVEHAGEDAPTVASLNPAPRAALLARLRESDVRLVISGHLHASRDRVVDGIRHLWLPACAFLGGASHGGTPAVGALSVDFTTSEAAVTPLPGLELTPFVLAEVKQHGRWKFLRDMPPCPPEVARAAE